MTAKIHRINAKIHRHLVHYPRHFPEWGRACHDGALKNGDEHRLVLKGHDTQRDQNHRHFQIFLILRGTVEDVSPFAAEASVQGNR